MPLTKGQWTDAIGQLVAEGAFAGITLYHNGNQAETYAALEVLNDATRADVKPLEAALEAAHTRFQSTQTSAATIETARAGLRDKIALAHDPAIAPHIMALFNAVLDQTQNQVIQPTRYNNVKAIVDAMPAALRNRFKADLLHERSVDYDGVIALLQQQQICEYARTWVTLLAILLSFNNG